MNFRDFLKTNNVYLDGGMENAKKFLLFCSKKHTLYDVARSFFPEFLLEKFIETKREECRALAAIPHPAEFDRYYNL